VGEQTVRFLPTEGYSSKLPFGLAADPARLTPRLNSRNADFHLAENPSSGRSSPASFSALGGTILTRPRRYLPHETHFATARMAWIVLGRS